MSDRQILSELYVLGELDEADRAKVERRIEAPATDADHELAAAVASFARTFHALDMTADPVSVRSDAWSGIERRLNAEDPAPVTQLRPARSAKTRLPWRAAALTAMAASVLLAAGLLWQTVLAPRPLVMAILLDDDGQSVALIEAFAGDSVRVTPLAGFTPEGAQVLQLWTKPDPAGPPVSLGILQEAMRAKVDGPDLPDPTEDQLYEITVEPEGGSPTGLPTGRIVGKGLAQRTY